MLLALFTFVAYLTFRYWSDPNGLVETADLWKGSILLHHPKFLVFFYWLNLLQSLHIYSWITGSHDSLQHFNCIGMKMVGLTIKLEINY